MTKKTTFASLAKNIAARRKALSLTQAQLAEALAVDTETFARFERGKHLPSLYTLERLAVLLRISASELLDDNTPPPAERCNSGERVAFAAG
jgi:transcriptional regulator with XRE-family HTH domain